MDSEEPLEGEIIEPEDEAGVSPESFWNEPIVFPPRPFGELLKHIRARISESAGRDLTQEEFGAMLGGVNQVTISRWQRGAQKPQTAQLEKIVTLGHEYGLRGLTLARLQQSLQRDVDQYASIDPRITELNTLMLLEDETYRTAFFNVVFALHYLLRGALQAIRREKS